MAVAATKPKHWNEMVGLLLFAAGLLIILGLLSYSAKDPCFSVSGTGGQTQNFIGIIGAYLSDVLLHLFGITSYLLPLFLFGFGVFLALGMEAIHPHLKKIGGLILFFSVAAFFGLQGETLRFLGEDIPSGGMLGGLISHLLLSGFSSTGAYIITLTAIVVSLMLLTPFSPVKAFAWLRAAFGRLMEHLDLLITIYQGRREKAREARQRPVQPREPPKIVDTKPQAAPPQPKLVKPEKQPKPVQATFEFMGDKGTGEKGAYQLPSLDLLDPTPPVTKKVSKEDMLAQSELLQHKLQDFDIQGRITQVYPGPVVTMFEFEPAPGVKVSKITNLADDLALAMKAGSVRIVAPLPGKAAVGIEVPNNTRETVYFRQILETPEYQSNKSKLKIPIGKDIFGASVIGSIDKMPHLLVAGATGSGKSVAINSIILAILYNAKPSEVKLAMVDPKMLELSVYEGIPHLLSPVVTQPKKAAETLRAIVAEMERRYRQLAEKGNKNIDSYNKAVPEAERLPYIVVIIDELADLMMTVAREVEDSIMRLAQMARAAGIHLIVATQRPSVDVITGLIKANLPSRISFQVSSKTDSRTILDANGAENLLGMGDMLFQPPNSSHIIRCHGCFVSEAEIKRVVEFVRKQGKPNYELLQQRAKEIVEAKVAEVEDSERDEHYQRAVELVQLNGQASTSFIQRRLRVGYNRAARMIEMMQEDGIVGPADGAKPRQVLVRKNMDGTMNDLDDL
ncbi:MAG: DNA translocase FtsK 4TM domain-containing protein [Nitrospiraceae bacterium]|nr:DNA translocase FtsK 4TM domain-containing protein [Nitrospiraceae bacterium]